MPAERWRGDVNGLLYSLMFTAVLDDAAVNKAASQIIGQRTFPEPPEGLYEAIEKALRSAAPLTDMVDTRHTDAQFRDFLRKVKDRLDELRPWPQPPYLKEDISQWISFNGARPVATIDTTVVALENFLRHLFESPSGSNGDALILRLRSGETIALQGPSAPGESGVVLLQRDSGDPHATIAAFSELTGFPADKIRALV